MLFVIEVPETETLQRSQVVRVDSAEEMPVPMSDQV
jgi:hypothetical protein